MFAFGNDAQFWDRDEPRYADATRGMLVTGDFVVPTHNGEWRLNKPIGIYWLQAACASVLGVTEFAMRLPSAVFLALACVLLMRAARRWTGRWRPGLLAAAVFATTIMTQYQAHAATIDATLVFVIAFAMLLWFAAVERAADAGRAGQPAGNAWHWVGFYALGAVGVLLKMPVIVAVWLVVAMSYFVWSRDRLRAAVGPEPRRLWSWWPHAAGIALGLVIAVPWLAAVTAQTDGEFLSRFLGQDVVGRATEPMEGHRGPIIYYVPVLLVFFFPWALLLLVHARGLAGTLPRETLRFLVCWAVAPVVMFSVAATKLPHYIFPSLPALALLTALALDRAMHRHGHACDEPEPAARRGAAALRIGVAVVLALVGVAALSGPFVVASLGMYTVLPAAAVATVALGVGSLALAVFVWRREPARATLAAVVMMFVVSLGVRAALPAFDAYKRVDEIAALLHAEVTPPAEPLSPSRPVLYGFRYAESSLAYYTDFRVRSLGGRTDLKQLLDVQRAHAERSEPMYVLIAWNATFQGLDEASRAEQMAVWHPEARALFERMRPLGQVGPVFHYNTSRNHWRQFEFRIWEPDPTSP